ncbi:MAG: efflux RND transporter periplasmic adaptor subunit [Chlamydiota bacterium]
MKRVVYSLFIAVAIFGCSKKKVSHEIRPIPIQAVRAESKDVPYYISTVGRLEPYEVVNLMAQVSGQLVKTYFADGADLKQGQLLYLIDQRSYIAALEQAEGELEENLAKLRFAERTAERSARLVKDGYISQKDYDSLITTVIAGDAAVKQSRAAVDNAKINLGYTTIYSPSDGRAGESKIRDGNLILESGETTLVTLNKIDPIYSVFYINEKELPAVRRYREKSEKLKVYVTIDDKNAPTFEGELTFIDNGIDVSTGMIKLKATHPNEDKMLWPNQFVKVKLVLDTLESAVIVPSESVRTGPDGKYLYVVKGNQTVERREVIVGQRQRNNTVVITEGIKPGERVVTVGQFNLYPGAQVRTVQTEDDE